MASRFVGNQLLQTNSNAILAGASTASLSLWACVNPGCNVASSGGVILLGDAERSLTVTLTGTGTCTISWTSNDGTRAYSSSYGQPFVVGKVFHLAAVWQAGTQSYYLNGMLVHSDTQPGTLGGLGARVAGALRIGSDSSGTDVTLEEPTLWVGYALSLQDVRNIRDRVSAPTAIGAASVVYHCSLDGPPGLRASVGDAGLADTSVSALNIATIVGSSPVYLAGSLLYVPQVSVTGVSVGPSGKTIVVQAQDSQGNPTAIASVSAGNDLQTLTLNQAPSSGSFTLALGSQTTAAIAVAATNPSVYAEWVFPVTPGQATLVEAQWYSSPSGGWSGGDQYALYEIYDGSTSTRLGYRWVDQSQLPTGNQYTDDPYNAASGNVGATNPAQVAHIYETIAGGVTFTQNTCRVRLSGQYSSSGSYNNILANGVRVTQGTTDQYCYQQRGSGTGPSAGTTYTEYGSGWYNGWIDAVLGIAGGSGWNGLNRAANGSGAGMSLALTAAQLQSSIGSLASVGSGNVTVTQVNPATIPTQGPTFNISFAGTTAYPTLVASDPAVTVVHNFVGGSSPSLLLNGATTLPLTGPIMNVSPNWTMYVLPQYPAATYASANQNQFTLVNLANWVTSIPSGFAYVTFANNQGLTGSFQFQGLRPGQYKISGTWPSVTNATAAASLAVTDGSGNALFSATFDQTRTPADFTEGGVGWKDLGTFTLTGTDSSVVCALSNAGAAGSYLVADSFRLGRTDGLTSTILKATDVLTFSAPENWGTAGNGPIAGSYAMPVTNQVGGSYLVPFTSVPKPMAVGANIQGDAITQPPVYANLARKMTQPFYYTSNPDANGYPTILQSASSETPITVPSYDGNGKGRGVPLLANGNYTVLWDGTSNVALKCEGLYDTYVEDTTQRITGQTTGNRKVYAVQAGVDFAPSLSVIVYGTTQNSNGTYNADIRNLRVYGPEINLANPPKYHPNFLSKLQGLTCLRFMDALGTNNSNVHDYSDLMTGQWLSVTSPTRTVAAPVVSVQGYTGTDPYFNKTDAVVMLVTTSVPHTLNDGQRVSLSGAGTATLSNGSTLDLGSFTSFVHVLSPTTLLIRRGQPGGPTMTNTTTGGTLNCSIGQAQMPFVDVVDLCNVIGCDLWLNIPQAASDACVTQMAAYVAANLKRGLKVHVEYANECWNFQFSSYEYCCLMTYNNVNSHSNDNDYVPGFVLRTSQVHALFAAQFAAARRTYDLVRTYGTQGGYAAGPGAYIASYAHSQNFPIDELAVAPYIDNNPAFTNPDTPVPIYDLMDVDQCLDLLELNIEYGDYEGYITTNKTQLVNNGFTTTPVVCYEGGPQQYTPGDSYANFYFRNNALTRHPRAYGVMLRFLQKLQDNGCTLFNLYQLQGFIGPQWWSAYWGVNQQPGTGNATLDAINVSNPLALDQVKSEVGGAMAAWAALHALAVPRAPYVSMANGHLRGNGLRRAFRGLRK